MSKAEQQGPMWMAVVAAGVQLAGLTCLSGGILGALLAEHELFDAAGPSAWAVVGATAVAAIANVAPDDAQVIAMMGFAEATTCRVLGAALAASGLSAVAVGLAALARRAPDRRPLAH